MIQKQISSSHGVLTAEGNLDGFIVDDSEQVVIGSTNPLLNQQIPSSSILTEVSYIQVQSNGRCGGLWLIENSDQMFPKSPHAFELGRPASRIGAQVHPLTEQQIS